MKSRVTRVLSIGIALAAVTAIHAQDKTITANVPFNFYAGSTPMPQGVYRVSEMMQGGIAWLASAGKGPTKAMTTHSVEGNRNEEPARLVFRCYGQDCFLSQIWTGDVTIGRALVASKREKDLAKNGAAPTLAVIRLALHQ